MKTRFEILAIWLAGWCLVPAWVAAQSVCLPAPRLLTTMPMGGQRGTSVEIKITGDNLDIPDELIFSHPGIKATRKLDDKGQPISDRYVVEIAADCPTGIHEARMMTRLGMSASRAFNVGTLPEMSVASPNRSLETAMTLPLNSICNAVMTPQA